MTSPPRSKSSSTASPTARSTGRTCCAISGRDFSTALDGTKDLRTTQVLDSLNDLLGPHIFPAKEDGSNPRACPSCENGQLSLKLGKFGAFIGCSNYPECKYTRTLSDRGEQAKGAEGERPGVKVLGEDPKPRGWKSPCATAVSAPMCRRAKARSRNAPPCPTG